MKKIESVHQIINDLVITFTVPCNATADHLTFIRWCAKQSGFTDNIAFTHEPTAAFAHIYYYMLENNKSTLEDGIYVIIDSGAGTTDTSVIELKNQKIIQNDKELIIPQIDPKIHFGINKAGKNVDDAIKQEIQLEEKIGLNKTINQQTKIQLFSEQQKQSINQQFDVYKIQQAKYEPVIIEICSQSPDQKKFFDEIDKDFGKFYQYVSTENLGQQTNLKLAIKEEVFQNVVTEESRLICNFIKIGLQKSEEFCKLAKNKKVTFISVGGLGSCQCFINQMIEMVQELKHIDASCLYSKENEWTRMLQVAICAGGNYLDDEKDHVQLNLQHTNYTISAEQMDVLQLFQTELMDYTVTVKSFQFCQWKEQTITQQVHQNLVFKITAGWDGIKFNISTKEDSQQIQIKNSRLISQSDLKREEIPTQPIYYVQLNPKPFPEANQMLSAQQRKDFQFAELNKGKYQISVQVYANVNMKWKKICQDLVTINWKKQ
uniref:Fe-S protein assembly chaperone HscA domain-containing protein n=1 Tax=Trepomonas sp. PC1 TaxID=1076344 RepID=A0A146K516_9EUKA|eukprot:JAP90955.1 Fe-S protein assembly chaperone HscA domain-containing protein [Trepomonas sp. PC1]